MKWHLLHQPLTGVTAGLAPAVTRDPAGLERQISALTGEVARLREREREREQLTAAAREAGVRIRSHLDLPGVMHDTVAAIEQFVPDDVAYLHLYQNGRMCPPLGHEHDWIMPSEFLEFPPELAAQMQELLTRHASQVLRDLTGPDASQVPPAHLAMLRRAGVVSFLVSPFGVSHELAGVVVAMRRRPGKPWSEAEVDAFSSIAADIGWALDHARQYEAENQLVSQLRELDQRKSDFIATISHELRTPLTSIVGYLELLIDGCADPLTAAQRRMLDAATRNAGRLRLLIEDVLTLSRIESGTFRTTMVPVWLPEVIGAAVTALRPAAAASGVRLTGCGGGDGLIVRGNAGQLERALRHLLSNAVKFTPAGGTAEVSAGRESGSAVITIRDNGIGIPEADKPAIHTPFFRASNALGRSIPGTGLGLAIVRAIVANHDGSLGIESSEGRGTVVTIRLPVLSGPPAGPRPEGREACAPPAAP